MSHVMTEERFDKIVQDVSKHFDTPEALVAAGDLSRDQKLALLRQWEYDLHLLQVATEENMTGTAAPGANAERIRQIHAAAEKLGGKLDSDKSGAAKTGVAITEE